MGVRGGIAHVNVLSATVVEVTLVYGEWIRGETRSGQSFELTRAGEFTRIALGELPTPPVIIPTKTIRQAANSLGIEGPGTTAEQNRRGRLNRGPGDRNSSDAETAKLDGGTGDRRDSNRRNRR